MPVTAVVTLQTSKEDMPELKKHAINAMSIFDKQAGFISKRLLESENHEKLLQIVEWESKEFAMACMMSSDWQSPKAVAFMQFIESGKATMIPENYFDIQV